MSRSKRRKLFREGTIRLTAYQEDVLTLRAMTRLRYLPLGAERTGNAPNDLLCAWAHIRRVA